MTTATEETRTSHAPVVKYNITDAAIAELKAKYGSLEIKGIQDKVGYQAVRTARLEVRTLRASVEKTRKDLKFDALEYGRMVDSEAKRITALLEEIEIPLNDMEEAIDAAKEAEAAAIQKVKDDKNRARVESLEAVGVNVNFDLHAKIIIMNDEEFEGHLEDATEAYRLKCEKEEEDAAELARLKAEEEERNALKAEADRKAKEAEDARLEEQRKEQAERQAALDAQAAEQAKKAAELKAEADRLAKEKADAQAEQERKAKEDADRAERDRVAAEKAAALLPDKEKVLAYLTGLRAVPIPVMATPEGQAIMTRFKESMKGAAAILTEIAKA